ncbi:L,D-transpeptidase [bacterium]|nr:L,D-transpeptidase [bacterium]
MLKLRAMSVLTVALLAMVVAGQLAATPAVAEAESVPEPVAQVQMAAPGDLVPVDLDGASRYRTRAQELVAGLVSDGETDLDALIDVIVSDHREVLDHIVVNLSEQRIYECNVDGEILKESKISSGRSGYDTPPGTYHVVNKAPKAYSQKYEAWMLHWMGLTKDGGYGMHGLEGSSYERLLGRPASHGCIRLSREYAKDLFSRVNVDLPVYIVDDPELNLHEYEPLSRQAALAMVLEVLSPSDPWDIYY